MYDPLPDPKTMMVPGAAAKLLPGRRPGRHADRESVMRWIKDGAKAIDGRIVKLEAIRIGQTTYISEAALAHFIAELNRRAIPAEPAQK